MGDSYRPRRSGGSVDSYQPSIQQFHNTRGQSYRSTPRSAPPPPLPPSPDGSFSFRGAADNYRPPDPPQTRRFYQPGFPQSTFSFEVSGGLQAPRFNQEQPPQRSNRPARQRQKFDGRNAQGAPRGGRQGRRFGPKPAHSRNLLTSRNDRETTPEQLVGMNANTQPRYAEYISSDSDDNNSDSESNSDKQHSRAHKRIKTETSVTVRPRWSNPDPYSVLPPTDLGIGPKKDIVQTIRKAKVEGSAQQSTANAVKDNADFIGFDDFDDHGEDDLEDGEMVDENEDYVTTLPSAPPVPAYDFVMPTDEDLMREYARDFNDKKRKRDDRSSDKTDVVPAWRPRLGHNPAPWYKPEREFTANHALRLHREVVDFYEFVRPQEHEAQIRYDLIDRVERVILSFKGAHEARVKLHSFGSYASGLYLPVADMDIVACSVEFEETGRKLFCQVKNQVHKLGRHLLGSGIVRPGSLAVITSAKVPIIKFADKETGIKIDISFENDSGLIANQTVKKWRQDYPEMPVLVSFVKQLLAMRDLNEVVTGGIGGFTIICLVVSMLQHISPSDLEGMNPHTRYAHLLLHFLDLYGNKFDVRETGIELAPPRRFEKTGDFHGSARINPTRLTVIDPNRSDNDLSGGSKNIDAIFGCFRMAFLKIMRIINDMREEYIGPSSILECVLGGNYSSFFEQRTILDQIDRVRRSRALPTRPPLHASSDYYVPPTTSWNQYPANGQAVPPSHRQHYHSPHNAYAFQQQANVYTPKYPAPTFEAHSYPPTHALPEHLPPPPPPSPPPPPPDDHYVQQPQTHNEPKKIKKAKSQKPAPEQPKWPDPQPSTSNKTEKKGKKKAEKAAKRANKAKEKKKKKKNQQHAQKTAA